MLLSLRIPGDFGSKLIALARNEREDLANWIQRLSYWRTDDYVRERSHLLSSLGKDTYVFHAGDKWRIFFKIERDGAHVELLDFSTREIILQHARG